MTDPTVTVVTGGVDTHLDLHVAAALDQRGAHIGTRSFPATPAGYRQLLGWLGSFGNIDRVGVEGTGAYGAGLARHLDTNGVLVIEVDRPNRRDRRRNGKSDPLDAVAAARAAPSGEASSQAEDRTGNVEAIRACGSLAAARSPTACEPSTSCGASSPPHPTTFAKPSGGSPAGS